MTRPVAGIQARMGSRRLPGKSLADVAGKPLLRRVYERVSEARSLARVFVLTSTHADDDPLAEYCEGAGIPFRRGPLDDVLARYLALLAETDASYVARVTGDCPLVSAPWIDRQVEALVEFDADFAFAPDAESTLAGQSVLSARALRAAAASDDPRDREHVGAFLFARRRDRFRTVQVEAATALRRPDLRLSVDEAADLEFARAVFAHFAPRYDSLVPLEDVLAFVDANPDVRALNADVVESEANLAVRRLSERTAARIVGTWS